METEKPKTKKKKERCRVFTTLYFLWISSKSEEQEYSDHL